MTHAAEAQMGADFLLSMGRMVRAKATAGRNVAVDSREMGVVEGDTIYAIDRRVEETIIAALELAPDALKPLTIVAEGLGASQAPDVGPISSAVGFRLLVDPIDGTRGLMYDKRSAWFLAAMAPDRGAATSLSEVVAAVMVEIPTSKQGFADLYLATAEGQTSAFRENLLTHELVELQPGPSRAPTLRGGFAQVSNFFPGTKVMASDLMEQIATASLGEQQAGIASIFDDQYISTGGQLVELVSGRDRFSCDLRPLFYDALVAAGKRTIVRGLECHPYDLAGILVAKRAGVILTDGFGRDLDGPFDVTSGMHWIGYANDELRQQIEPVIQQWLKEHNVVRPET